MRSTTFSWNDAVFEAQEDTVATDTDAYFVANLLPQTTSNRIWRHYVEFGTLLATTHLKSGDPGFSFPSLDAPSEQIIAFYQVYEALPRGFRSAVINAKSDLLVSINPPELTPGLDPNAPTSEPTASSDGSSSLVSTEPSPASPAPN